MFKMIYREKNLIQFQKKQNKKPKNYNKFDYNIKVLQRKNLIFCCNNVI